MPLRLDNAKGVAHMPTAEQQQQKNKPVEPRFKIDRAASPMPENRQPERLAPGRDQIGMVGEIISESWARSNRYTRARSSESAFPRPSVTFTALLTANDDQKTGVEIVRNALSYHRGDVCQDNRRT